MGREGGRYLILSAAGLVIQVACFHFTAHLMGLPADGALVLGVGLSFFSRFWSCRAWVWQASWSSWVMA
jgi:putative flippase GtrA